MSAMDDIQIGQIAPTPFERGFGRLRDGLLALCLTILAALALQALDSDGKAVPIATETALDWRGNSAGPR